VYDFPKKEKNKKMLPNTTPSYDDIIHRLVEYRKKSALCQKDFSKQISLTQSQLSKIENIEQKLSFHTLQQIRENTSLDIDYLITGVMPARSVFADLENTIVKRTPETLYKYYQQIIFVLECYQPSLKFESDFNQKLCHLLHYTSLSAPDYQKDNFTNVRKAFHLRQVDMASLMKIDLKSYRSIEKNISKPNAELLQRIYSELNISPSYFLTGLICNYSELNILYNLLEPEAQKNILALLKDFIRFLNNNKI
jgi:transcriptional regulator with XRE-family HTH domain